jgi:DNA (cytosine-5)-methyltransferase 1
MKQSSILGFVSRNGLLPKTPVVDLFCGIGGYSCGAELAGHKVVLAVDSDPVLLDTHAKNHSDCLHTCVELPSDNINVPTSGKWHLHGSPPCTKLSIMQPHPNPEDRSNAKDLVRWFLSFALTCGATTWTMEQVPNRDVVDALDDMKRKYPLSVDYVVVDAVHYEVPQHRKRLFAGSLCIIHNLRSFKSNKRKLTVRDTIPSAPCEFIRNNLYSRPHHKTREMVPVPHKDKLRSVDKPSYTILARGHARWANAKAKVLRHLSSREKSLLQTFPRDYVLPKSNVTASVGVGNAVPPRLAAIMMRPTLL